MRLLGWRAQTPHGTCFTDHSLGCHSSSGARMRWASLTLLAERPSLLNGTRGVARGRGDMGSICREREESSPMLFQPQQ
jgi:hypothetical protein